MIKTGNVTMGGGSGTLGLVNPDSQGTALVAKLNNYLIGLFQAGKEWGASRGYKVTGKSDPDGATVHAEEYLLAALETFWSDLQKDNIIMEGEKPAVTIKINKSPCPVARISSLTLLPMAESA